MTSKIWAVVPAGGVGNRMNSAMPKQYLKLANRPVVIHTLERLCQLPSVESLVIGISGEDRHWQALGYRNDKLAGVVEAGQERVDTVENCLQFIVMQGGENDWALVHDAARPCVMTSEIEVLIKTVLQAGHGGILAVPLNDTIKRSTKHSSMTCIQETLPRENLWRAMTPQMFKVGRLLAAIQSARASGVSMTDEASAIESTGEQPLIIACSPYNIKITLPEDIALAEMILGAQQAESGKGLLHIKSRRERMDSNEQ